MKALATKQQNDYHDHDHEAETAAIHVIGRSEIKSASAEQKNEDDQEQNEAQVSDSFDEKTHDWRYAAARAGAKAPESTQQRRIDGGSEGFPRLPRRASRRNFEFGSTTTPKSGALRIRAFDTEEWIWTKIACPAP